MSDKEDVKKVLEACRKSGPMDENLVRGTTEPGSKDDEEYYADAMRGTKYLQFSHDEDEGKDKNKK